VKSAASALAFRVEDEAGLESALRRSRPASAPWLGQRPVLREIGSVHLRVLVEAGDRLSELPLQEPFSYELAQVFVAADDEAELVATYRRAVEAMGIVVDHDPEAGLRPRWHLALP